MVVDFTNRDGDEHALVFLDVRKAQLEGKLEQRERAYIELPGEAGGGVGRLCRWLCGMRHAASAWEAYYTDHFESVGFARGQSAPTFLHNPEWECRLVVSAITSRFCARGESLSV